MVIIGAREPFTIYTDCKDLIKIFKNHTNKDHMTLFALALAEYNLKICYIEGGKSLNKAVE